MRGSTLSAYLLLRPTATHLIPHPAPYTHSALAIPIASRTLSAGNRASSRASRVGRRLRRSVCPFSTTYGMPRTAHSVAIGVSLRLAVSGPLSTSLMTLFAPAPVFVFVCALCVRSFGLDVEPTQASCVDAWQHSLGPQHSRDSDLGPLFNMQTVTIHHPFGCTSGS